MKSRDIEGTPEAMAADVIRKAGMRAARHLGLDDTAMVRLAEAARRHGGGEARDGETSLNHPEHRASLLLVRLYRALDALTGGDEEAMRAWMASPNTALQSAPARRIETAAGLADTVAYVEAALARY